MRDYRQPALVERFLDGPEYTVTVVGNDPPRALPVLQRALEADDAHRASRRRAAPARRGAAGASSCPGSLDAGARGRARGSSRFAPIDALECRDFARVDFRLDADGRPCFLEINPLPTFAPDGSFGILAELEGRDHEALLADVLAAGLRRLGLAP